ncbi:hypothetical protein DLH72_01900 [Candidatus Gracilibacteria bacterium]|nr:MAG: hypothetical protein DLH72_01900 [Candidatus Gracilibacteria bacterium]
MKNLKKIIKINLILFIISILFGILFMIIMFQEIKIIDMTIPLLFASLIIYSGIISFIILITIYFSEIIIVFLCILLGIISNFIITYMIYNFIKNENVKFTILIFYSIITIIFGFISIILYFASSQ